METINTLSGREAFYFFILDLPGLLIYEIGKKVAQGLVVFCGE